MNEKTTDQGILKLRWGIAVPLVISLLIGSNGFTAYSYQIDENAKDVLYNDEKNTRKLKNQLEKVEQLVYISELKAEILHLKHELKEKE